jgi:hypothetical protein
MAAIKVETATISHARCIGEILRSIRKKPAAYSAY